jgi:hypothetical protein
MQKLFLYCEAQNLSLSKSIDQHQKLYDCTQYKTTLHEFYQSNICGWSKEATPKVHDLMQPAT